ncbi:MAG: AI-2E family transporter [Alphaproteobacteria bacterium]
MTTRAQVGFWLGGLVVFGLCLYVLRGILLPFVAGMAVAYLLDPIADRFESWKLSRTQATSVITALFVIAAAGAFVLLLPLLHQQLIDFIGRLPDYVNGLREFAAPLTETLLARLAPEDVARVQDAFAGASDRAVGWALGIVGGIWQSGLAIVNLLSLLFITPIVTFYLLRDWDRIVAWIDALLPRAHAEVIRTQVRLIDETLAGFVRGQGLVCLLLGVAYAAGLTAVGLDFGLIVGLATGLVSFIPYFGAIFGLVVSVGMALLQFDEPLRVGLVAAVFVAGQVLEGNVLTPKLVGERVGLHPVWVIFGALAGGSLFGFVGILLAVPVSAVIGVLVRFAVGRYVASALFRGPAGSGGGDLEA